MLGSLAELAKEMKKTSDKQADENHKAIHGNEPVEIPEWWKKLSKEGKATYIRQHKRSKLSPYMKSFLEQEGSKLPSLKDYLAKHPEDRKKLREVTKNIAKNPQKALKEDFEKLDAAKNKKPSKKDKKKIEDALDEVEKTGKSHHVLKAIGTALAVAGVLTLGGGLLATGTLPYAILTIRAIKDTHEIYRDIKQKMHEGEDAFKAVISSVSGTLNKTLRDPKVIASMFAIHENRKHGNSDEERKGRNDNDNSSENTKKKPKIQRPVSKATDEDNDNDENEDDNE